MFDEDKSQTELQNQEEKECFDSGFILFSGLCPPKQLKKSILKVPTLMRQSTLPLQIQWQEE